MEFNNSLVKDEGIVDKNTRLSPNHIRRKSTTYGRERRHSAKRKSPQAISSNNSPDFRPMSKDKPNLIL